MHMPVSVPRSDGGAWGRVLGRLRHRPAISITQHTKTSTQLDPPFTNHGNGLTHFLVGVQLRTNLTPRSRSVFSALASALLPM